MKKFGVRLIDDNTDIFHSIIVGLKKLNVRFHVDGEYVWIFENELEKLSTDGKIFYLSGDDGSVFSFHEINDDDLDL